MFPLHYILNEAGEPEPTTDIERWGRWFQQASRDHSRIVAQDRDEQGGEDILVSTVFLGLDHSFTATGPPILWETMILGGPLDQYQERYSSREDALRGHQAACALLRREIRKGDDPQEDR